MYESVDGFVVLGEIVFVDDEVVYVVVGFWGEDVCCVDVEFWLLFGG